MIEAWTDKGAAQNHIASESKVEIQSSNSDYLIESSKLFFFFLFLFFLFFPSAFWFKALTSILYYMGFPTRKIEAFK